MEIFVWLVAGAISGGLAALVAGEREQWAANMAVGICGALAGGIVFESLAFDSASPWSALTGLGGALFLLGVVHGMDRAVHRGHTS